MVTFELGPKNQIETKLKRFGVISFTESISRPLNIYFIIPLPVISLVKIYIENKWVGRKEENKKQGKRMIKQTA